MVTPESPVLLHMKIIHLRNYKIETLEYAWMFLGVLRKALLGLVRHLVIATPRNCRTLFTYTNIHRSA